MEQRKIRTLVNRQRRFFYTGKTQHMAFREMALRRLQISIMAHEDEITALRLDLGKSASEAYMCETGMVLAEISYMLKHMRQFGKDQTVRTPLAQFASRSFRKPSPYGVTLIMSPWNYPFLLTMERLWMRWQQAISNRQAERLSPLRVRSWRRSYRNVCPKNTLRL